MSLDDLKSIRKRRVPRRLFYRRAGVLIKGVHHFGFSHQLGEGGLLLEIDKHLDNDHRLLVSFYLPEHGLIVVRGVVRYRMKEPKAKHGFAYGVQFENLDFEIKRQIRNFVASQKTSIVQDFQEHEAHINEVRKTK